MIEFGPKLRSTAVMLLSKPVRMAATPMMVPVPMITPSTVRKARSLWDRMVCKASRNPLEKARRVISALHSQGFDGIELGGTSRGVNAEEHANDRGKPDAKYHAEYWKRHGHRSSIAHNHREEPRRGHTHQSADPSEHGR